MHKGRTSHSAGKRTTAPRGRGFEERMGGIRTTKAGARAGETATKRAVKQPAGGVKPTKKSAAIARNEETRLREELEATTKEKEALAARLQRLTKEKQELEARRAEFEARGIILEEVAKEKAELLERVRDLEANLRETTARLEMLKKGSKVTADREKGNMEFVIREARELGVEERLVKQAEGNLTRFVEEYAAGEWNKAHFCYEFYLEQTAPYLQSAIDKAKESKRSTENRISTVDFYVETEERKGSDASIARDYLRMATAAFEKKDYEAANRHLREIEDKVLPEIRSRAEEEKLIAGLFSRISYEEARAKSEHEIDHKELMRKLAVGETPIIDAGEWKVLVLKRLVGSGAISHVFEGQLIDFNEGAPKSVRVAVKVYHPRATDAAGHEYWDASAAPTNEFVTLEAINAALEREPAENFPGGVKRAYYPLIHTPFDTTEKKPAFSAMNFLDCIELEEYVRPMKYRERFGMFLQILHALAIAEGAGFVKTDKSSEGDVRGACIKIVDWNMTQHVERATEGHLNERLNVRSVLYQWLHEFQLTEFGERVIKFEGGEAKLENCEKWPKEFAVIVQKIIMEGQFQTIREAYQYALGVYNGTIPEAEVSETARKLVEGAEAFNATLEARKTAFAQQRIGWGASTQYGGFFG